MKILKLGQMLGGSSNTPSASGFQNVYSLDFDGVDQFVDVGNDSSLRPALADGITISLWAKFPDVLSPTAMFFSTSSNSSNYSGIWVQKNGNGKLSMNTGDGGGSGGGDRRTFSTLGSYLTNDKWHHIVFLFADETSANWNIYIDGTATGGVTSGTGSAMVYTTDNSFIGKRITTYGNTFMGEGHLDEVSLFSKALTSGEITSIYNSGNPTDLTGESDLIAWWRNGDTRGSSTYPTIEDYSSNSNNGTMNNMASGDIVTDVP
tara:strand:+ start:122 stop:907 length:786 start_codon:yes stop_codon:yes gene_type:complete